MTKIIELITLSKTFTIILNRKSKFGLPHTSFSNLGWFFGGFWGANIIKSGHNLKNIWKFPKHNLNISFVGNLIIYSKGCKQLYSMPHPFKEAVITFWFFVWVGHLENWTLTHKYSQLWQKKLRPQFCQNY